MIRILFLYWIITRHAPSQGISWTVGTSVPRYNEDLKLVCTVPTGCCTSSDRIWANASGHYFLNSGISASPNKYVEEWDGGTTGFSLIIKNLQLSDVGVDYDCQYSIGSDKHTLTQDATWEYQPSLQEKCSVEFDEPHYTVTLQIARSAPSPTVFASYGGKNVTSDLTLKGPTNFETWFYTLTVSIDIESCIENARLNLSVITGTSTTVICNEIIECRLCFRCGLESFMFCWFAILCESIIMMEFLLIIIWKNSKDSKDEKENLKLLLIDAVIAIVVSMVVSALLGILIGTYTCLCYDNTLPYRLHYLFILLGYAVEVFVLIMLACFNVLKGLTGKDVSVLIVIIILGPLGIIGNAVYILYIFIYIKKKTWKDVDWKDVGIMLSIFITHGIPLFLTCIGWPTKKKAQGENSQSVESGSSCWPICRVGQDPNTSSSNPEKVRRSSKKESADKKPTGFVRPQPSRAQHLGTDNTGRAEYSAENEMYSEKLLKSNKPRLLPSIGQQTDSPRPLPQMPASAQQGGNQLAPLEKKKKKRKKKREAKQSDEENSTEL